MPLTVKLYANGCNQFCQNLDIILFHAMTPVSPSKSLPLSPEKDASVKSLPSKAKSPNHRPSPRKEVSLAREHEEIDWLKGMRLQRQPTPQPERDPEGNPTKSPDGGVLPPIAEELCNEDSPLTPMAEEFVLPVVEEPIVENPLAPIIVEELFEPAPPVRTAVKAKRARGRLKKTAQAGNEQSKETGGSIKQKSPDSGHSKELTTKRIKHNAELPIHPRRSARREEMAKPKEPSKTVNYTQCKGARGWVYVDE
ncbi:uncharacterized protein EV420DRAFT_1485642 [Desarmillaria tabescens]|uniref:Uncharacterized protein n=1 Tax=Armillaria tabescens TaxID=1929756 RepID=A0AA39JHM5_ARMTA|nr:uncharacterized protein EV420DRAFT_1485642 [Desarmillaria tabescens]KAK0441474.1 hypothetical protein EV420DRAFT_1485642 [Desarmillaria tabescens]